MTLTTSCNNKVICKSICLVDSKRLRGRWMEGDNIDLRQRRIATKCMFFTIHIDLLSFFFVEKVQFITQLIEDDDASPHLPERRGQ